VVDVHVCLETNILASVSRIWNSSVVSVSVCLCVKCASTLRNSSVVSAYVCLFVQCASALRKSSVVCVSVCRVRLCFEEQSADDEENCRRHDDAEDDDDRKKLPEVSGWHFPSRNCEVYRVRTLR